MLIMDRECQSMTVAFLLFDGMQLLDFANPWEVFGIWNRVREMSYKKKVERIKFGMDSKNTVSKQLDVYHKSPIPRSSQK